MRPRVQFIQFLGVLIIAIIIILLPLIWPLTILLTVLLVILGLVLLITPFIFVAIVAQIWLMIPSLFAYFAFYWTFELLLLFVPAQTFYITIWTEMAAVTAVAFPVLVLAYPYHALFFPELLIESEADGSPHNWQIQMLTR